MNFAFNKVLSDFEKIAIFPKYKLGSWPTPIHKIESDIPIYVKRDDLSGFGRQGIKTRKLETFLGYHLQNDCRNLIVIVPNISNLQNDLELIVENENIKVIFIIANDPPLAENLRTISKAANNVNHILVGNSNLSVVGIAIWTFIKMLFLKGEKYKIIPPGASHPSSLMGSANGIIECHEQFKGSNVELPKKVFVSASSGGSAAGLILGTLILQKEKLLDLKIHIAKVYPIPMRLWIFFLLNWTKFKYNLKIKIRWSDINVHKAYDNIEYGGNKPFLKKKIEEIERLHNLQVDHIYGAQSWLVMEKFLKDRKNQPEAVLFWHCGFTIHSHLFNK